MPAFKDIAGARFGRLVASRVSRHSSRDEHGRRLTTLWQCVCDCGNIVDVTISNLTAGASRSCGCGVVTANTTHGVYDDPLYKTWAGIVQRCTNPSHAHYPRYGGRGITVHPDWAYDAAKFIRYVEDTLGAKPSPSHTIDRVENDTGYAPGNLRWATQLEQQNNRSSNRKLSYRGEVKTMSDWCRDLGIDYGLTCNRIHNGWDTAKAFETPVLRSAVHKDKR